MQLSDIDYDLPEELIAQVPVEPRDSARLLVSRTAGERIDRRVADICDYLGPGDLLVVNDTRVVPARLSLQRATGGAVEVLLLEQDPASPGRWEALVRGARRLSDGEVLSVEGHEVLRIGPRTAAGDTFEVEFIVDSPDELVHRIGSVPLPPYIRTRLPDPERYQTVYARREASAAAPTAGLHFTPALLETLESSGVRIARVELVVGLDTFKPISTDDPLDHAIHTESYDVPAGTMEACAAASRVVAVGTTAARALESAATGRLSGRTDLFITPGHRWRAVDMMLTNFHMPRTSLLLMIGSFIGEEWRDIYSHAVSSSYRFLSFGDAMLLGRR